MAAAAGTRRAEHQLEWPEKRRHVTPRYVSWRFGDARIAPEALFFCAEALRLREFLKRNPSGQTPAGHFTPPTRRRSRQP
jgi:hypothetical protein